jgi:hypothetical protein
MVCLCIKHCIKGFLNRPSYDLAKMVFYPFFVNLDYFSRLFATILLSHGVPPLAMFFSTNYITSFEVTMIQLCEKYDTLSCSDRKQFEMSFERMPKKRARKLAGPLKL